MPDFLPGVGTKPCAEFGRLPLEVATWVSQLIDLGEIELTMLLS